MVSRKLKDYNKLLASSKSNNDISFPVINTIAIPVDSIDDDMRSFENRYNNKVDEIYKNMANYDDLKIAGMPNRLIYKYIGDVIYKIHFIIYNAKDDMLKHAKTAIEMLEDGNLNKTISNAILVELSEFNRIVGLHSGFINNTCAMPCALLYKNFKVHEVFNRLNSEYIYELLDDEYTVDAADMMGRIADDVDLYNSITQSNKMICHTMYFISSPSGMQALSFSGELNSYIDNERLDQMIMILICMNS